MALSTMATAKLPETGQPVVLRVRTIVREDALDLYGFLSRPEEELFLLLTSVSQVGPKMALTVLSGLDVPELVAALSKGEVAKLTKIHGVGKKTAERLVLELKDRVKDLAVPAAPSVAPAGALRDDVASALANLGYARADADRALDRSLKAHPEARFEELLRETLRLLSGAR